MMSDKHSHGLLLNHLEAITKEYPAQRKIFVGPVLKYGKEVLATLARRRGGWIGWEATTLYHIAQDLAFVPMHGKGIRILGDVEQRVIINQAFDTLLSNGSIKALAGLANSLGFRHSLLKSLVELRLGGISVKDFVATQGSLSPEDGAIASSKKLILEVASVLEEYESILQKNAVGDSADQFKLALEHFNEEAPVTLDGLIFLGPTLNSNGLRGELVQKLKEYGAVVLPGEELADLPPPQWLTASSAENPQLYIMNKAVRQSPLAWLGSSEIPSLSNTSVDFDAVQVDFFSAATPADELREVLRRATAEGWRWDQITIAATDTDTYGVELDVLCQHIGASVTMLNGIHLARTRVGRSIERWFSWINDGLTADLLRQALEAGDISIDGKWKKLGVTNNAVARELRKAKIGWGRRRYVSLLDRIAARAYPEMDTPREDEDDAQFAERVASRQRAIEALAETLHTIFEVLPEVPEKGVVKSIRTTPSALAQATLRWLDLFPRDGSSEQQAIEPVRAKLLQLVEMDNKSVSFSTALAIVREVISDIRAWPVTTGDRKPWMSAGGMLHLTDLAHVGTSGRPRVFVVGLDADRTLSSGGHDAILSEPVRQKLPSGSVLTGIQRREEQTYTTLSALAAIRGRMTLSYSVSGSLDGREAGPSSLLLQAFRIVNRDTALSYKALREAVHPPRCAVPLKVDTATADTAVQTALLDARDVWMDTLTDGSLLLAGEGLVRESFAGLNSGLIAFDSLSGSQHTPFTGDFSGIERAALSRLSRRIEETSLSPSALEKLSQCPLSWLYRYGIGLFAPDDPEFDSEVWLDAAKSGLLMHQVFETFSALYMKRQGEIWQEGARDDMEELVSQVLEQWRDRVPPPGETVYDSEAKEIQRSAMLFLDMERQAREGGDKGEWLYLEHAFGVDNNPPGTIHLSPVKSIKLKGRIDRIDRMPDGTLRAIDYKTGSANYYSKDDKKGTFNGGRHLQAALYAKAIENLLDEKVSRFEYRFPTSKGRQAIISYSAEEISEVSSLILQILTHIEEANFIPTNHSGDCSFCDYSPICRSEKGFRSVTTPRVTWATNHGPSLPQYESMIARRTGSSK